MTVTPPTYAAHVVTPPVSLSPSSASTFEQCPRRFRYSAIDQIAEPATNATAKGTAVHRSLELLFSTIDRGQRTREHTSKFLAEACEELAKDGTFSGIANFPGLEKFISLAETSLDGYFSMEDPNVPVAIMTETKLTRLLGHGELRGIIDRVDEAPDGSLSIIDYKTGKPPRAGYEDKEFKAMRTYALLLREHVGKTPVSLNLYYLRDGLRLTQPCDDRVVTASLRRTEALWSTITTSCEQERFQAKPGPLCRWCAFQPFCPGDAPIELLNTRIRRT